MGFLKKLGGVSCMMSYFALLGAAPFPLESELKGLINIAREIRPSGKPVDTIADIQAYLGEYWARKPGQERNTLHVAENITDEQILKFKEAFYKLHMVEAQHPKVEEGQSFVILGASYERMQCRFQIVKKFLQTHPHPPVHVILLAGYRELEKQRSDYHKPLDAGAPEECLNEIDAAEYIMKHSDGLITAVVATPKEDLKPGQTRATTVDNATELKKWLDKNGLDEKKVVIVTNQPYGLYQLATIQNNFPGPQKATFQVLTDRHPWPEEIEEAKKSIAIGLDLVNSWLLVILKDMST